MAQNLIHENVWLDKPKYEDAECAYHEGKAKVMCHKNIGVNRTKCGGAERRCRKGKAKPASGDKNQCQATTVVALEEKLNALEKVVMSFQETLNSVVERVKKLGELNLQQNTHPINMADVKPAPKEEDDGVDLFGSDSDEDDAADEIRQKRLADYEKPVLIAKSNIILDVKPWDDETDMKELENAVRKVQTNGLVWGASKLVPLAYGIHKLQISCVVEDDIVSVDWLQEKIQEVEDFVQSVDIAAFNKV
ncbi:hypothetical protein FQR65_LT14824 [Abscondita terminalis]|nr:hypothetical protein FQR65_LT14824 [Abscondita terminalis]